MSEAEFTGTDVLSWMRQVDLSEAGKVLIGCGLDNQVDDDLMVIESVEPDDILVCVLGGVSKRITPPMLVRMSIIDDRPNHPLSAVVDAVVAPEKRSLSTQDIALRKLGLTSEKIVPETHRDVLTRAVEDHKTGRLPTPREQNNCYEAFKAAGIEAQGAQIIHRWREISLKDTGAVSGGILIKLAYCLRHSGDLDQGLKATNASVEKDESVRLSHSEKSILATMRAALLLDLFQRCRDLDLLSQARDCAEIALAIEESNEIEHVFMRLEAYEKKFSSN